MGGSVLGTDAWATAMSVQIEAKNWYGRYVLLP